ncbi:MAG TPA: hypothetical protein VN155_17065 [Devosia sp.]|nr:hypothetical protein [Devosia sp.]
MFKTALAAAFACLCLPAFSAEPCLTIVGLADFLSTNEKGAAMIEVVPLNTQAIDNLVIYRAESGSVLMIPEFEGCLFGQPVLIDVKRKEFGA